MAEEYLHTTPEELLRRYGDGERDFRHTILPCKSDLAGVDLSRTILIGSSFPEANLSGANLRGATVIAANLRGADLRGAKFAGTDLTEADLTEADLTGANLSGAYFRGANLTEACLEDVENLGEAFYLGRTLLCDTIVTEAEIEIFEAARRRELRLYKMRE